MERMDRDFRRSHRPDRPVFDQRRHLNSRRGWGVLLIIVGIIALGNVFDIIPYDVKRIVISWQMFLIAIGVISLINNRSVVPGVFLIAIGGISLVNHFYVFPEYWRHAFWPAVLLLFGIYLIAAPPRYLRQLRRPEQDGDNRDFIDEVAVFSGGDRIVTSQNFKGGRILSIFGGSKINLMNAKLAEGQQILDTLSIFGGSNVIVPAGWTVKVEVVAIFGGFSDKRERMPNLVYDQNTMLVIKGMAIFGGGEVKSYGI
jgi:predicted membrane protein